MKKTAIFLAALAMAIPGGVAEAQNAGVRIRINYYSDASLTNQVGEFVEFCNGSSTWNGELTEHGQYFQYDC